LKIENGAENKELQMFLSSA